MPDVTSADALIATPDPDPDAVANQLLRAGDVRAAEWLVKSGYRARFAFSWRTAVERFEIAELTTQASDTARDFFAKKGYVAQQRNTRSQGGEWLVNTTMEKTLGGGGGQ